jgi:lysophospholipase L1-like esterase
MPHKEAIVHALNAAFPTIFTSGTMMAAAGLLIGSMSAQPVVSIMGTCIGRGTIISIILVLCVLPSILVLGDSITQGYDAVYPSQSYANKLAWALDAEIVNQAIGGEIFRPAILDENLPFTPDLITVAFGTNDWSGQTAENFEKNADGFYTKLATLYPNTPVFAILPIWRADWEKVTRAKPFHESREILRGLAEKHPNFRVIDGMSLTPHLPAFFSDLYLHPNDLGFEIYAQELVRQMQEIGF